MEEKKSEEIEPFIGEAVEKNIPCRPLIGDAVFVNA